MDSAKCTDNPGSTDTHYKTSRLLLHVCYRQLDWCRRSRVVPFQLRVSFTLYDSRTPTPGVLQEPLIGCWRNGTRTDGGCSNAVLRGRCALHQLLGAPEPALNRVQVRTVGWQVDGLHVLAVTILEQRDHLLHAVGWRTLSRHPRGRGFDRVKKHRGVLLVSSACGFCFKCATYTWNWEPATKDRGVLEQESCR